MDINKSELMNAAIEISKKSYSPYSNFRVGAAVLGADGVVYTGTNVENVSYGLTVCAERCAIYSMIAGGVREFLALAVYSGDGESCTPCGACRQIMTEFASCDVPVFTKGSVHELDFALGELIPHVFSEGK